jgi:FixJ family two-component response regulator
MANVPPKPTVFVVDDDPSMQRALTLLFKSVNLDVWVFTSTAEFLRQKFPDVPSCLVLDVRLPGISGIEFQTELTKAGINIPIIVMTGFGDIPMSVRAMKAGAVDFLTKPFRDQDMLDAVGRAIENDRVRRGNENVLSEIRTRFESLTQRERQVMVLIPLPSRWHVLQAALPSNSLYPAISSDVRVALPA